MPKMTDEELRKAKAVMTRVLQQHRERHQSQFVWMHTGRCCRCRKVQALAGGYTDESGDAFTCFSCSRT